MTSEPNILALMNNSTFGPVCTGFRGGFRTAFLISKKIGLIGYTDLD